MRVRQVATSLYFPPGLCDGSASADRQIDHVELYVAFVLKVKLNSQRSRESNFSIASTHAEVPTAAFRLQFLVEVHQSNLNHEDRHHCLPYRLCRRFRPG